MLAGHDMIVNVNGWKFILTRVSIWCMMIILTRMSFMLFTANIRLEAHMPKVNEEHFANKEAFIVDAAIRVCQKKPAYDVTLRDIVKESGISQGGMYCYFSSIDEVFAAILNRCYNETNLVEGVEKIFEKEAAPETIIETAFVCMGQMMEKISLTYGKLINELNTIFLNDTKRKKTIGALLHTESDCNKIDDMLLIFINKHIDNGYFTPTTPKSYILFLVEVTLQGFIRVFPFPDEIKNSFYEFINLDEDCRSSKGMAKILSKVVIDLLKNERGELLK